MHQIALTVTDAGNPKLSSATFVHVHVADFNDNAPIFDNQHYVVSVREDKAPGTVISEVLATDDDRSDRNGVVRYRVVEQQDPSPHRHKSSYPELIRINEKSGKLVLNQKLYWQLHNG